MNAIKRESLFEVTYPQGSITLKRESILPYLPAGCVVGDEIEYLLPADLEVKCIGATSIRLYTRKVYDVTSCQPLNELDFKHMRALGYFLQGQVTGKVIRHEKRGELHIYRLESELQQ
jgi:hypothetical protein